MVNDGEHIHYVVQDRGDILDSSGEHLSSIMQVLHA